MGLVLAICTLGVLQIYSATRRTSWENVHYKQMAFIATGILLMWVISQLDYHALLDRVPALYLISLIGLLLVLGVGQVRHGARRWIPLFGDTQLQVSEFVKVVLVLLVARYFSGLRTPTATGADLLRIGGLVGAPMLLVMLQPDLGTALSYVPIVAGGVLAAGFRWKHLAALALAGALALPVAWWVLLPFQRERLLTFANPERDPLGHGYQSIQSRIAVGAGRLWGTGIAKGTQTQLRFLPETQTDFIFAAYAEEHGFTGVLLALSLYFVVLMRIIYNAQTAADRAGTFICICVCMLLLFHVLVNVGMVTGRMPVTGIPLPLMSAGGSSLWTLFLLLGLVNSVRLRRFVN